MIKKISSSFLQTKILSQQKKKIPVSVLLKIEIVSFTSALISIVICHIERVSMWSSAHSIFKKNTCWELFFLLRLSKQTNITEKMAGMFPAKILCECKTELVSAHTILTKLDNFILNASQISYLPLLGLLN